MNRVSSLTQLKVLKTMFLVYCGSTSLFPKRSHKHSTVTLNVVFYNLYGKICSGPSGRTS